MIFAVLERWLLQLRETDSSFVFTRTWLRYVRVFAVAIPSVVCQSVTLVHPTQAVEPFGKISSPLCTLAITWPPCKVLRSSSQDNPSVGGVKRKRGMASRINFYSELAISLIRISDIANSLRPTVAPPTEYKCMKCKTWAKNKLYLILLLTLRLSLTLTLNPNRKN